MRHEVKYENRRMLLASMFIVFAVVLSSTIILTEILYFDREAESLALHNAVNKTKEREHLIEIYLKEAESGLISIRESDFFEEYVIKNTKKNMESLFMTHMKSHSNAMQLRLIDENGIEIIRVERNEIDEPPTLVDKKFLQDKRDRYYFEVSKDKEIDKVWFSGIDLNVERENVEVPLKSTFRAILPIEIEGKFGGILIVNYFADAMLDQLTNTPLYDLILCNHAGEVIYHYEDNTGKNWGNILEHGYNIKQEFPNEYAKILSKEVYETDLLVSRQLTLPMRGGLILILQLRDTYLIAQRQRAIREYTTIIVIVIVFSIVLTFLIVRFLSNILLNIDRVEKLNKTLGVASSIAKIGFWEIEAENYEMKWSDGIFNILEVKNRKLILSKTFYTSYIAKEEREVVKKAFSTSVSRKEKYFMVHKVRTTSGNVKVIEARAEHYYDKNGAHVNSIGSIYDITDKYESERKFENLLHNASDGIHILNKEGELVKYSHSFAEILGYTVAEMEGLSVYDWYPNSNIKESEELMESLIKKPRTYETVYQKKDGEFIDVQINAKGIDYNGKKHLYASLRDITEIKKVQKELEDSKKRWKFAVEGNKDGLWDWNIEKGEVYFSKQCCSLIGSQKQLKKNSLEEWRKLVHPDEAKDMLQVFTEYLEGKSKAYIHEHRILCESGEYLWVRERGIIVEHDEEGKPIRMIGTISDISDYMEVVRKLKEQAYLDELTELHNRKAYNERLDKLLKAYEEYGHIFSVIMFDIDDFKIINDSYGHAIGDKVLQNIGRIVKKSIDEKDECYRVGGEEFIILLPKSTKEEATNLAENIRQAIKKEVKVLEEKKQEVTISLGVVEIKKEDTADSIYKRADEHMYKAKEKGKDNVVYL